MQLSISNEQIEQLIERTVSITVSKIKPDRVPPIMTKKQVAAYLDKPISAINRYMRLGLDHSPMTFVKMLKEPAGRDRILSKDERARLWQELEKDDLLFPLVTLAVNLPLRRGQLLAITPDAIDLDNGRLVASASKGRGGRTVPLNSTALNTFRQMLSNGLIPFPLKSTGIRKRWLKSLKKAGIDNFKFHDLRHVMATDLDRNGVSRERINKLYAHSDMRMTSIYINPEFQDMADAVRTLDVQIESEVVQ